MSGTLYVVATPIGNLGDITARALDTLRGCERIAAEDTRRTRALLTHFGIAGKALVSLHAHSGEADVRRLVEGLLGGESVALVSDAGTPKLSDPGEALVVAAAAAGVRVSPIPGPSAVTSALSAAGLGGDGRFRFVGFLPRDGTARREAIASLSDAAEEVVLFEAANRLAKTLGDLAEVTPERRAAVCRELTKVHEEVVRGSIEALAKDGREWIGEIAVVLGPHEPEARAVQVDDLAIDRRIDEELAKGRHAKATAAVVAAWSGRPPREIYERVVTRKRRER